MKTFTFYVNPLVLEDYLKIYGRSLKTKDYEYHIALHANHFFGKQFNQKFSIAFETKNKPAGYPDHMDTVTAEQLKEILKVNTEDTPVDFALAPLKDGKLEGYAYPFQIKKFIADADEITSTVVAEYINNKANHYRAREVSMIVVPVNKVDQNDPKGFDINELKSNLKVDDNALFAIYIFQYVKGETYFKPIWSSSRAKVVTE